MPSTECSTPTTTTAPMRLCAISAMASFTVERGPMVTTTFPLSLRMPATCMTKPPWRCPRTAPARPDPTMRGLQAAVPGRVSGNVGHGPAFGNARGSRRSGDVVHDMARPAAKTTKRSIAPTSLAGGCKMRSGRFGGVFMPIEKRKGEEAQKEATDMGFPGDGGTREHARIGAEPRHGVGDEPAEREGDHGAVLQAFAKPRCARAHSRDRVEDEALRGAHAGGNGGGRADERRDAGGVHGKMHQSAGQRAEGEQGKEAQRT